MHVFFIFGPAAAGKYTIGHKLSDALGVPLFHNHLTVDLVSTLFEFGSEPFRNLRAAIWRESFAAAATAGQSFVFTFHPENSVAPELLVELQQLVEQSGGAVHYIELVCSDQAVAARLDTPQRAQFGKLRDIALYQQLRADGVFDSPQMPEADLRIDTEAMQPEQAAAVIANWAKENRITV